LHFYGVDILKVKFDFTRSYDDKTQITLNTTTKVHLPKEKPEIFRILMYIELNAANHFDFNVLAVGNFEIDKNMDTKTRKQFINSNAPAIMFPYLRAFISTFTSNCGSMKALNIPTQFFEGELEEITE